MTLEEAVEWCAENDTEVVFSTYNRVRTVSVRVAGYGPDKGSDFLSVLERHKEKVETDRAETNWNGKPMDRVPNPEESRKCKRGADIRIF